MRLLVLLAATLLVILCWQVGQVLADLLDGLQLPGPR